MSLERAVAARSLLLVIALPLALAVCPKMVSREAWGALPPRTTSPQRVPVSFVVVHHGGLPDYCENMTTCAEQVRIYQKLHMEKRGWDDIGYSFLVGEDGAVYEGRGWRRVGAHAPQYNNQSIGICFIGDFSGRLPNRKALDAVDQLISCGVENELLIANYTLLGHRQASHTACPGESLYHELTTWPFWDPKPNPRKYPPPPATGNVSAPSRSTLLTSCLALLVSAASARLLLT